MVVHLQDLFAAAIRIQEGIHFFTGRDLHEAKVIFFFKLREMNSEINND